MGDIAQIYEYMRYRRGGSSRLLDGDALREIARLIDVGAAVVGDVVREQLQRNRQQNRQETRVARRHLEDLPRDVLELRRRRVGDDEDAAAARLDFLHVREALLVDRVLRQQDDDGNLLVDERDRAVLHLAGGVTFGVDVRDLLQLERALERDREVDAAAEVEEVARVAVFLGDLLDRALALQALLDVRRQVDEILDQRVRVRLGENAAPTRDVDPEQVEHRELRRERFRARDGDLRTSVGIDDRIGFARDAGVDDVADRQHFRAALVRRLHCGQRVCRLTGLRDHDEHGAVFEHRVARAELARVVDLGRDARDVLEEILADEARVRRSAAGDEDHAPRLHHPVRIRQLVEADVALLLEDTAAHRVDDRLRLLVDLLQEEMPIAALLRGDGIPRDGARLAHDRIAGERRERHALARHLRHLAVLEKDDATGVVENRRNVGGDEVLVLAETDDDRGRALRGDEAIGTVLVHDDDRERAFELLHDGARRVQQILATLHVLVDEVRDHLGIGFRRERTAARLQ